MATNPTHVHALVSWADERGFEELKRGLRESLSRRLNAHARRRWLVHNGSRKQVKDRGHLNYLMAEYLPKHSGWKWREGIGYYL